MASENWGFHIAEISYRLQEPLSVPIIHIAADFGRDSDLVFGFSTTVKEARSEIDEISLSDVFEADETYVTAGEKGER